MYPIHKENKEELDDLEQKYNNIKKFTNSTYVNTGKIELELATGTYLFWIATSGGGQTPSLILANLESSGFQILKNGGMHKDITYTNGKLTITTTNKYFLYGYIKLR